MVKIMVLQQQKHHYNNYSFIPSSATALIPVISIILLLFKTLPYAAASASASASETEQLLHPHFSTARTLLQAQQGCPVNFENLNYTIITSRCRGPRYPPNICCDAFKDFACPYADDLNDQTNNCANTMFSYINLNGHYPPGIFANECRDSKRGLECTVSQSSPAAPTPSAAATPAIANHCLHWLSFLSLSFCFAYLFS